MEQLIEMLGRGGYSCVIANGEDVRCFSLRGVADLYNLLRCEPQFLRGAYVADKVVGKGAAALMVAGGVKRLYTYTISESALELLRREGVDVESDRVVDHIINRRGDGWCPVESMCRGVDEVGEILPLLDKFIESSKIDRNI